MMLLTVSGAFSIRHIVTILTADKVCGTLPVKYS